MKFPNPSGGGGIPIHCVFWKCMDQMNALTLNLEVIHDITVWAENNLTPRYLILWSRGISAGQIRFLRLES